MTRIRFDGRGWQAPSQPGSSRLPCGPLGPTVAPVPGLDGEQIRKRLADARLYLCTDARAERGDLAAQAAQEVGDPVELLPIGRVNRDDQGSLFA